MSTILVVDDNAVFRRTIAAVLRQNGYNVVCAADGQEALTAVRSNEPDLVLLDVAMPAMDGLTCLRALRANSKSHELPVIIVSAVATRDTVVRAGQMRVQGYLLKSQFSVDEMLDRVRRLLPAAGAAPAAPAPSAPDPQPSPAPATPPAGAAGEDSSAAPSSAARHSAAGASKPHKSAAETLERLRHVVQLSAMPAVLREVTALCGNPHSTMNDVAGAVRKDPALTMRVMRVANSNFYGTGKQARDLAEAARRIGMSAVKNIALAAATVDHFADANPTGLVPQRFWEHSLACAMLSELLAQAAERPDKEQLFLAGLLHDIGRLVLSSIFPAEYEHVAAAIARGTLAETAERDTFGLTHADATREVMHLWKVPAVLIDAGALHELPVERIQRAVRDAHPALIVALANRLAHALALGDSGNPVLLDTGEHARALGLPREAIRSVATQTVERTETTTLFYASRSQEEFRAPLAGELRSAAGREFKLAVLADNPGAPGCDASQTFFERLGWLDAARPQLAVLSLRAAGELPARTRELQALDAAVGRRLPIVVVSGERGLELPAPLTEGRLSAVVPMPVRYVALIESLARVARPEP